MPAFCHEDGIDKGYDSLHNDQLKLFKTLHVQFITMNKFRKFSYLWSPVIKESI